MTLTQSQGNVNYKLQTTRWFEKSHIVAIGIDEYNSPIERLKTAVYDAKAIADIIKKEHGFEEPYLLQNKEATREQIINVLMNLKTTVGKNDRFIFYYAGHGIALSNQDEPEGYLIPQDATYAVVSTYLSMCNLIKELSDIDCRVSAQ